MVPVHETKGPIVQSQTQDAHIVCVEDTMAKSNTLPLGHQLCSPHHHLVDESKAVP